MFVVLFVIHSTGESTFRGVAQTETPRRQDPELTVKQPGKTATDPLPCSVCIGVGAWTCTYNARLGCRCPYTPSGAVDIAISLCMGPTPLCIQHRLKYCTRALCHWRFRLTHQRGGLDGANRRKRRRAQLCDEFPSVDAVAVLDASRSFLMRPLINTFSAFSYPFTRRRLTLVQTAPQPAFKCAPPPCVFAFLRLNER